MSIHAGRPKSIFRPFFRGIHRSAGGTPLLLDTLAVQPVAAYSLRKLRTAYTGSAIRVRRSSDNAEQDIGFVDGGLDTASLLTFCGAGDGFVVTWYGQNTGTQVNVTQSTAAAQPAIVAAGVVQAIGGKPAVNFDGGDDYFLSDVVASLAAAPMAINGVFRPNSFTGAYRHFWAVGDTGANAEINVGSGDPGSNYYVGTPSYDPGTSLSIATGTDYVSTVNHDGTNAPNWLNGAANSITPVFGMSGASGRFLLGASWAAGPRVSHVRIPEWVVFAGAVLSTASRQTIERDQGTYYGITVA